MFEPAIYRVIATDSGSLSIMPKPLAGEWIEDEFLNISNKGINLIVSLLEYQEAYAVGLHREKEIAEKNGMSFISFPIQDRGLPNSLMTFKKLISDLYNQISNGVNVVVHCRAGIGRSGLVAAGILLHHGLDPVEAFALVSLKRGVTVPDTEEQKEWLLDNYKKIKLI